MSVFGMITSIVVAALIASLIKEWIKKNKTPPVDLSHIEARLDKLESLQKRIEVLEAIVTDKGYDLKKEIDSLS